MLLYAHLFQLDTNTLIFQGMQCDRDVASERAVTAKSLLCSTIFIVPLDERSLTSDYRGTPQVWPLYIILGPQQSTRSTCIAEPRACLSYCSRPSCSLLGQYQHQDVYLHQTARLCARKSTVRHVCNSLRNQCQSNQSATLPNTGVGTMSIWPCIQCWHPTDSQSMEILSRPYSGPYSRYSAGLLPMVSDISTSRWPNSLSSRMSKNACRSLHQTVSTAYIDNQGKLYYWQHSSHKQHLYQSAQDDSQAVVKPSSSQYQRPGNKCMYPRCQSFTNKGCQSIHPTPVSSTGLWPISPHNEPHLGAFTCSPWLDTPSWQPIIILCSTWPN